MAQHDYIISNQTFPNTRADINNVLSAIASNNSGTSAPTEQYAGQFWIDTTSSTWTLYIHDGSDDIQFATIDTSANTVNFIDSELGDNSVTTSKIADANVTSAKLSYPLTTFSSTGIDDNATSTAITIHSSGRVGIGTSSPTSGIKLHVQDTSANLPKIRIDTSDAGNKRLDLSVDSAGAYIEARQSAQSININAYTDLIFKTGSSGGLERMRIDSSGNLGIGTSSPTATLNIQSSTDASIDIDATSGSTQDTFIKFSSPDNGVVYLGIDDSEQLFKINNASNLSSDNHFVINGSGNVGIGTTSPSQTLDVVGSIEVSDGIYIGGTGTANKLDDYEEGTFTPIIEGSATAGTATYSAQVGKYTKIGNAVTIQIVLVYSGGTGSGSAMYIKGLPFTGTNMIQSLAVAFTNNISLPTNRFVRANIGSNHNFIRLFTDETGGGATNDLAYDGAGDIGVGGTYLI